MPRTAQPGQLTPAELRCLARLADGLSTVDVANELGIQLTTLHRHMGNVRGKLGEGSYAHNLHRSYLTHQLPLPAAVQAPIDFTPKDLRLWTALATRPSLLEVAAAAGLTRHLARQAIRDLAEKAQAETEPHLIKLEHAFRLLPSPDD
ncbi:LuxR C-terminal-related transcriptional regulator [Streptomyces sp. Ac-502]|uniref:LuxR C-terminal-related transcriptional regulator n=1 Tax=Streptomyces sp. Ac-502 TaxID=3342801 RepID=UPI0038629DA2